MFKQMFIALGLAALKQIGQVLWDVFWDMVFAAVEKAETVWTESGCGAAKKDHVLQRVELFLKAKKYNKFKIWCVMKFMNKFLDEMIEELNKNIGRRWIEKAIDLKKYFAGKIKFID